VPDYPKQFEFDVLLKDGLSVHIRPIKPGDIDALAMFHRRVGPESIYNRYFSQKSELSPEELRHFTSVDYDERMAFVVIRENEIIAVGRYDVIPEKIDDATRLAEVAFLVRDDFQGRGVGSNLLQHLAVYGRLRGVTEFEAYVLAKNTTMLRLFRNSGYKVTSKLDTGVFRVEYSIDHSLEAREAEWVHEKRSVTASIMPVLYPTSAAVIGASRDDRSIGGRLFRNLLVRNFAGPLYPVNPSAEFVHSVKAYPTVKDIPGPVELAFVTVPAAAVAGVIEDCGEKGVKAAVVISAGFAEGGDGGATMEAEMVAIARRYGMRIVGPNCMGVLNTDETVMLDGQFGPTFPPRGNVAMSSQSGALGLAILEQAADLHIGISSFVSLGNRADVSPDDLLLFWEDDPMSDVIVLYMESFGNPRRFGRLARRVSKNKPIVVVKSGRTKAGARAAASHTGSLASLDVAADALFRQSGVIRTDTLQELFDVTALLSNQPLPAGRRVALLSNAGGPAILVADALESLELELPVFSENLQSRLQDALVPAASTSNPVDMVASAGPQQYSDCLSLLLESDEVDTVIVIFIPTTPDGNDEVILAIRDSVEASSSGKTILGVFMGSAEATDEITKARIPVYPYPESATRALAAAVRYREWREQPDGNFVEFAEIDRPAAESVLRNAVGGSDDAATWLDADEVNRLLGAYGIRTAGLIMATSEDDAVAAAASMSGTVVLKVSSPTVVHKSDIGGVALDVFGEEAVRAAYRQVIAVADDADGVLVQEFLNDGHEVIVGMSEDPLFGPLIVFGLGGIFVELMKDVSFRINPLTDTDAREMLSEVRSADLLTGYRGAAAGDTAALQDLILRISSMVEHNPEILEMDLNPVKVFAPGEGVAVVDARIRVRRVPDFILPSRKDIPGRMV